MIVRKLKRALLGLLLGSPESEKFQEAMATGNWERAAEDLAACSRIALDECDRLRNLAAKWERIAVQQEAARLVEARRAARAEKQIAAWETYYSPMPNLLAGEHEWEEWRARRREAEARLGLKR